MIPDKNFKMKPATKAMLAAGKFKDNEDRAQFKRMMIQAQLSEEAARRAALKSNRQKDAE